MADDNPSTIERLKHALAELRAELAQVTADRDRLQKQVASLGEMQTETIVLDDEEEDDTVEDPPLPSLEELMRKLDTIAEAGDPPKDTHSATDPSIEMIAPEVVFPENYESDDEAPLAAEPRSRPNSRVLVFADTSPPIKYPLYKQQMTIGRSKAADISVDSQHISRVHARIALHDEGAIVEDVASKNGIKINARSVKRHLLRHGDVLSMGRVHFTFIEMG